MRDRSFEEHSASDVEAADSATDPREVSARPGDGSLSRVDAVKDERFRRWDVATPAATIIGRASSPLADLSDTVRRLHDEQHPAMAGHSTRMHRLDKARITHAYCSALDVTPWERDRAMGIMVDLDLTVFGSQRAIEKIALVVIQHVVDEERKRRLGLDDPNRVADLTADEMQSLYDLFEPLTDDERFQALLEDQNMTVTTVNRLTRTLREQLAVQDLEGAVLGRSPHRDPAMPAIRDRGEDAGPTSANANATGES